EPRHVIEIRGFGTRPICGDQNVRSGTEFNTGNDSLATGAFAQSDIDDFGCRIRGRDERCVAIGDVDTGDVTRIEIPREREISAGAPPTRSVDLVYGIGASGDGGHRVGIEPGSVWTILVVFVSAEEMPIAVPIFRPGMIPFLLSPL